MLGSFIAGDLLGWDVQHTSIARMNDDFGNLLKYIHNPGSKEKESENVCDQERMVEGEILCPQIDRDFDVVKGTRHTLPLLLRVCDDLLIPKYGLRREDFLDFWARAFALDCLISNRDRHAGNWAVIVGPTKNRMASLYDNGSSLGCLLDRNKLERVFGENGYPLPDHLKKLERGGLHHVRLTEPSKNGTRFESVCLGFLREHPGGISRFEEAAAINTNSVRDLMDEVGETMEIDDSHSLTEKRKRHMDAMLQIGVKRIESILGEMKK